MNKTTTSRLILIFMILIIILQATVCVLAFESTITDETGSDTFFMQNSNQRKLCRVSNGTMYFIGHRYVAGDSKYYMYHFRSIDNGNTWIRDDVNPLDVKDQYIGNGSICVDSSDNVYCTWQGVTANGSSTQIIVYKKFWSSNQTWSRLRTVSTDSGGFQLEPSVCVGKTDTIYFAWSGKDHGVGDSRIKYRLLTSGTTWSGNAGNITPTTTSGNKRFPSSVVCRSSGSDSIAVIYWNSLYSNYSIGSLTKCRNVPTGSSFTEDAYTLGGASIAVSPDTSSSDKIHIAFSGTVTGYTGEFIRYINCTMVSATTFAFGGGARCINVTTLADATHEITPSISLSLNRTVYITFRSAAPNSMYYQQIGGIWSKSTEVIPDSKNVDLSSSLYSIYPIVNGVHTNIPSTYLCYAYYSSFVYFTYPTGFYFTFPLYSVITDNATGVGSTNFTMRGHLVNFTSSDYTVGFHYGDTSAMSNNVTVGSGYSVSNRNFSYNITASSSSYYYFRAWSIRSGGGFNKSVTVDYTITKPGTPIDMTIIQSKTSVLIKWINPTVPAAIDTYKAVCRYSDHSYPTTPTSNTSGFNTTESKTGTYGYGNVTGLSSASTYYFTIWLYIEDSGSPTLHAFSVASYITGNTTGGKYNISFRYENYSYHPADFSKVGTIFNVTRTSVRTNRDYLSSYLTAEIPTSYWGSLTNPHWVYCPTFSPNTSSAPALYAFNNTLFDWQLIKPFGYNNGTFISAGGKAGWYRINAGTLHGDLYWSTWRLIYPSYAYSSGYTYLNVTNALNDTTKCQLEGFNINYNTYVILQPFGACNGTFMSNSTYRVNAGTTHGNISTYRLTYSSRETTSRCTLLVQYANRTEYNYFGYTNGATGYRSTQSVGDFNKTFKSYVLLNLTYTPLWFEFYWNSTSDVYRCYRQLVVYSPIKNYTFFISTNKHVHGESTDFFNNTLVKYSIQLIDTTGFISLPPGNFSVYAYLYTFDNDGNRQTIHSEYVDGESSIYPMLLYGRTYFIGIASPYYIFDAFAQFVCNDLLSHSTKIVNSNNTVDVINMFLRTGWVSSSGGIWLNYNDVNRFITGTMFRVYDYNNNTLGNLLYGSYSSLYFHNYTYAAANHSRNYLLSFTINASGYSNVYNITMFKYDNTTRHFNGSHINQFMNLTFGYSPFRDVNNPEIYVHWVDVLLAIIGILFVCSFAGDYAGMVGLVCGGFYIYAGAFISDVTILAVPLGVILIIFSLLYLWSKKQ